MSASILAAGLEIARIGADLLTQKRTDVPQATAEIVGQIVRFIPVADLRAHLDDFDRIAIDAAADVAEEHALKERGQP